MRNKSVGGGGVPSPLKSSMTALLCGEPDLTVGTMVAELGKPRAMGMTGSRGTKQRHSTTQSKVGVVTVMDRTVKQQSQESGWPRPMGLAS